MKIFSIIFLVLLILNCSSTQHTQVKMNSMQLKCNSLYYIKDYAPKIPGKIPLEIVKINDSNQLAERFLFDIKLKGKSYVIKYRHDTTQYSYFKAENGNIKIHNHEYYNEINFVKKKINSEKFYNRIHPNFLELCNEEKLSLLKRMAQN